MSARRLLTCRERIDFLAAYVEGELAEQAPEELVRSILAARRSSWRFVLRAGSGVASQDLAAAHPSPPPRGACA